MRFRKKKSRNDKAVRFARYIVLGSAFIVSAKLILSLNRTTIAGKQATRKNADASATMDEWSKSFITAQKQTKESPILTNNHNSDSSAGIHAQSDIMIPVEEKKKKPLFESTKANLGFLPFAKEIQRQHDNGVTPNGVMVIGMHRSGTSMLTGLLVNGLGYNTGEPMIPATQHNSKGYFELLPVVIQNWKFLESHRYIQGPLDFFYLQYYNASLAVETAQNNHESILDMSSFIQENEENRNKKRKELKRLGLFKEYGKDSSKSVLDLALDELHDTKNVPWIVKDPIMCITLRSWLMILKTPPAIVYTFRHPLDTAKSIWDRDGKELMDGLQAWLVYNKLAILNSADLCRVVASQDRVLADPMNEIRRIQMELIDNCGVPSPPREVTIDDVNAFIDIKLVNHNHLDDDGERAVLDVYGASKCVIYSDKRIRSEKVLIERIYVKAMKLYCDMQSLEAFTPEYVEKLLRLTPL